jgi:hypothetical protein
VHGLHHAAHGDVDWVVRVLWPVPLAVPQVGVLRLQLCRCIPRAAQLLRKVT